MVGKSVLKFILKVFFSPVFIALFIGLISYFFLFNNFYREYNYEVLNFFDNGDSKIYYSDIDNDGNMVKTLNTQCTGMGLKTLDKIIRFFNNMYKHTINYTIKDVFDNEGTLVTISIKRKMKE